MGIAPSKTGDPDSGPAPQPPLPMRHLRSTLYVLALGLPALLLGFATSCGSASVQTSDVVVVAEPVAFGYEPLDPSGELIEPLPTSVEEFFEDYLEIDYVPEKVALGESLFHDPRLSTDNTLSCASCHDLRYGGVDRAVTATGVRGQVGPINTPTVFNAALSFTQFWDGRAPDLEAQADGPPNADGEMDSNWDEITAKLVQDERVMELLHAAYPGEDFSEGVDPRFWRNAIGDFERTLITPDAPFDAYLRGDSSAISELAKEGYQVFKDVGCVECHNGLGVGGNSFQPLGREKPYFGEHTVPVDLGRYNVTGDERDRNFFKVPNLRNVALTGPWLHDGSQEDLADVVRVMGEYQLDVHLSDGQVDRIVAFLETLTGEYQGRSLDRVQNTVDFRAQAPTN